MCRILRQDLCRILRIGVQDLCRILRILLRILPLYAMAHLK